MTATELPNSISFVDLNYQIQEIIKNISYINSLKSTKASRIDKYELIHLIDQTNVLLNSLKELHHETIETTKSFISNEKGNRKFSLKKFEDENYRSKLVSFSRLYPQSHIHPRDNQLTVWSGFYNKTIHERRDVLALMYPREFEQSFMSNHATNSGGSKHIALDKIGELPDKVANLMVENCIGVLGIPLGLGLNFIVDLQDFVVPMAVEEPSVIAAASSAAKLIAKGGGFHTSYSGDIMTAQIQLLDVENVSQAVQNIRKAKNELVSYANTYLCASMSKRGGGALDIWCRQVSSNDLRDESSWYTPSSDELDIASTISNEISKNMLIVHIEVDVCEAMGANIVNTVAEGLSGKIVQLTGGRCGLRILTNLCLQRRSLSTFTIPVKQMGWKGVEGETVAKKLIEACQFGIHDPFRACTNNKGIMNGIDAVAIATGQDWRAIEAAAHCYASRSGRYTSLTHYELVKDTETGETMLKGSLELPLAIGTKGGALQTHPGYRATHQLLKRPNCSQLAGIMTSVGLAQNFAALRALAVTGIQEGHMALHARNIAVAAGAPSVLVPELCTYMLSRSSITASTANEYLQAHAIYSELQLSPPSSPESVRVPASIFYVEIPTPKSLDTKSKVINLNIVYEALDHITHSIVIIPQTNRSQIPPIQQQLLGDKGFAQLERMMLFLNNMNLELPSNNNHTTRHANHDIQNKLNLISILLNVLVHRLMKLRRESFQPFLKALLRIPNFVEIDAETKTMLYSTLPCIDSLLSTGVPLFLSLLQVFHYHLDQEVEKHAIHQAIVNEQLELLKTIAFAPSIETSIKSIDFSRMKFDLFKEYMRFHSKRWQGTMFLLVNSLSLGSEIMTQKRLAYLKEIGAYIEWKGTIAHDLARVSRAYHEHEQNACLYWMLLNNHNIYAFEKIAENEFLNLPDSLVADFIAQTNDYGANLWNRISMKQEEDVGKYFNLETIQNEMEVIRLHYQHYYRTKGRKYSL